MHGANASFIYRGYPGAFSALGKSVLFRRDPSAYVSIAAQDAVSLGLDFAANAEFTIEAWIKPQAIGPLRQTIVSLDPAYASKGYTLALESTGALHFYLTGSAGIMTPSNTIYDGKWSHIAVVARQAGGQTLTMIYVDGQQALPQWVAITPMVPGSGAPFLVGSNNSVEGDYSFVGFIDELAVYSKALGASDLLNHYEIAMASPLNNLLVSHGQQIILNRGLQVQAWVLAGSNLDASLWNNIHFTTPVIGPPVLKSGILEGIGQKMWGYDAPIGSLASDTNFLNVPSANLSNLVSIQYGDEQDVTQSAALNDAASYFQSVHKLFPNVLVHTNQTSQQLNEVQLRNLIQITQPDLLTYDTYFFSVTQYPGGSPTGMYNALAKYRKMASRGLDDTSMYPIPFGQFLQGYLSQGKMSESQVRAQIFAAWVFGAKWVSLFWYNFSNNNGISYLFGGWPDGDVLPGYSYYSQALAETQNLAKALVLLQSRDVYFIAGSSLGTSGPIPNSIPSYGVYPWEAAIDLYLKDIAVKNSGTLNNGLAGDVFVGFFRPYTSASASQEGNQENYFMIYNGLTDYNGTAAGTMQSITLNFDFSGTNFQSLQRLNRTSGLVEVVNLKSLGNSKFQLQLQLEGGTGDLFKVNDGTPFVGF